MANQAMEFIQNGDQNFRRKIDGCLVGFSDMMEKYRQHITESNVEDRVSASDFLGQDFLLEMMVIDFGCYESALRVMDAYAK